MTVKRKANADGAQRESQSEYGFDGINIVEKDLRREFQRNDECDDRNVETTHHESDVGVGSSEQEVPERNSQSDDESLQVIEISDEESPDDLKINDHDEIKDTSQNDWQGSDESVHILDSLDDILPTELENISELEMQPMPQRDNESQSDTDSVQSLNHPDRVSDAQEPSEREFTWMVDEREKVQF